MAILAGIFGVIGRYTGRVLTTALTPRGGQLVGSCHEAVERIEAQMLSPLSDDERVQLSALLRTCAQALKPAPRSAKQGRSSLATPD